MSVRCEIVENGIELGAVAGLIGSVTFGGAGLQYRRLEVAAQLARLNDPVFVLAYEDGAFGGCCVLDRRDLLVDRLRVRGVYRGSLCVTGDRRGRGIAHALVASAKAWIGPAVSWGCIDRDNAASLAVLQASGARDVAGLAMPLLYRQWPRRLDALEVLAPGRDADEAALLAVVHRDAGVRDVTDSRLPGFALRDTEGIRVSARVAAASYAIETMGAMKDALVRAFVTPFGPARRRFDPGAFRHVRLVDVAVRDGCEPDWGPFVSGVLAGQGMHFAATVIDPRSALAERLGWSREAPTLRVVVRGAESFGGAIALVPIDG